MNSDSDIARVVRSWLRADEHESGDRVLEIVLAGLDATPQRRSWWPARRLTDMNDLAKLAMGAAAVVVAAVIAVNFLPRAGVGGTGPTPSPSPTLAPSPSPTAAAAFPPAGELAIGRHSMTVDGVPFSFALATSDWVSNGSFLLHKSTGQAPDGAAFIFWIDAPVGVFTDPCAQMKGPSLGTSVADLAAAVAAVPGTSLVSGPTDVTVGGKPAKHVVLTIPEDIGCSANAFYLWYAPGPELARYATQRGQTMRVWIVDVGGTIVWIDGETFKGAGPGPAQELQGIIDSIQFE